MIRMKKASFQDIRKPPNKKYSAVWRSSNIYASGWKIHDFASPPYDGFAFSMATIIVHMLEIARWL